MTNKLRLLPLEGGRNFRDLGGYATRDGRSTRWNTVYRSGDLSGLTHEDRNSLEAIGVRFICDFRSVEERNTHPSGPLPATSETLAWDFSTEKIENPLTLALTNVEATSEDIMREMEALYRDMLAAYETPFKIMFETLASGGFPLVFHCAAGKDRTGIAAALLLSALGVDRATIVEDYALSERIVDYEQIFLKASETAKTPYSILRDLPRDLVQPLLRSDPRYIEALLNHLDSQYGSPLGYLRTKLEIGDETISSLQELLLEAR